MPCLKRHTSPAYLIPEWETRLFPHWVHYADGRMLPHMGKTIHDDAYGQLLAWLRAERRRRNLENGGCTMRALAPRLARLLGRPGLKFSWVAKVEQRDRRIDLLEYVAYCIALGADPHEGLQRLVERLAEKDGRLIYPKPPRKRIPCAAEVVAGTGDSPATAKERHKRRVD